MNKFKKLWGIRHIRWVYLKICLTHHVAASAAQGKGYMPSRNDLEYLKKVWKGDR